MWIEVTIFLCILGLLAYLDTRKPKNFPPGPKWIPIFGSLLEAKKRRNKSKLFARACSEMAAENNAPMVGLKFGKDLLVCVGGGQALKEFLTSEDLAGRPRGTFYQLRTWGKRHGLLLTDSDLWKEQRRFALRYLREFGFGKRNMSTLIEEEALDMVETIKTMMKNGSSTELLLSKTFNIRVLNTLWAMLAGVRFHFEDKKLKYLQGLLSQLFDNTQMIGAPFSHFPFLRFIAPELSGYNLYVKTHIPLWDFLNKELQKHKQTFDPSDSRDFIDAYLQMLNSPDKPESFSEQQLMAMCMDFFMAGSETTSKTLDIAFLYLNMYPEVQKKAQEEIDRVVGRNRSPTIDDRAQMPYVEAIVAESLRMFMGRGFGVPHRAMRDTTLCGYFIPKDTMVIAHCHDVLFGKDFKDSDPEVFRPDRYLQNGSLVLPDTFIPFGFGKHRCLGETLAKASVFLFISTLLQHFNFAVPCPPEVDWIDGVTPGPTPYTTVVTLRD